MMRLCGVLVVLLCGFSCQSASESGAAERVMVFGAASLTDVLEALEGQYEAIYPQTDVVINVAATSLLARQIEQGAPADVFFAANEAWVHLLQQQERVLDAERVPITNTLVVVGPLASTPWESPDQLTAVTRLALADPGHVPAGQYAREALVCTGMWDTVQDQIIPTLDVRAAMLSVRHGAAEAAIVYASDLITTSELAPLLAWPDACQPDIRYVVALLGQAKAPEQARRFIRYALAPAQQPVWEQFGFVPRRDE